MFSTFTIRGNTTQLETLFAPYSETEKHSVFHMCLKPYFSRRKGVHAYIGSNRISGYYESGEETRNGNLMKAKSWFCLLPKESEGVLKIRCIVVPEPFLLLVFWSVIVGCAIRFILHPSVESIVEMLLGGGMALVLLQKQMSETIALEMAIKSILSDTPS